MGTSVSVSKNIDVKQIVNNVTMETLSTSVKSCAAAQSSDQTIYINEIAGNVNTISQSSKLTLNMKCVMESINESKLQADIATNLSTQLEQEAKANPTLFNANVASTTNVQFADTINKIASNITVSNIQTCITTAIAKQNLGIGLITGAVDTISQDVTMDTVVDCMMSDSNINELVTQLDNIVKTDTKQSSSSGLDQSTIIIIVIACIIFSSIFVVIGVMFIKGGGGTKMMRGGASYFSDLSDIGTQMLDTSFLYK